MSTGSCGGESSPSLRAHRRYVNKEKGPAATWQPRQNGQQAQINKTRDVIYWYLDYREFADVVKYRIALMRKAIDEKIKNEVGKRGYICPTCGKLYTPLEIAHTFDPMTNAFMCELDGTELIEDNPALHGDESGGQDRMQRFNVATAPIRDALKSIEGARLPTINIVAWIAQNVATEAVPDAAAGEGDRRRVNVVFGAEDDVEAQRKLADEQRAQNALASWHLRSTVTGEKTALGFKDDAARAKAEASRAGGTNVANDEEDALLAAHYANMDEDEDEEFEETTVPPTEAATAEPSPQGEGDTEDVPDVMVSVAGTAKRLADITDADEELMTPDEYEVSHFVFCADGRNTLKRRQPSSSLSLEHT